MEETDLHYLSHLRFYVRIKKTVVHSKKKRTHKKRTATHLHYLNHRLNFEHQKHICRIFRYTIGHGIQDKHVKIITIFPDPRTLTRNILAVNSDEFDLNTGYFLS